MLESMAGSRKIPRHNNMKQEEPKTIWTHGSSPSRDQDMARRMMALPEDVRERVISIIEEHEYEKVYRWHGEPCMPRFGRALIRDASGTGRPRWWAPFIGTYRQVVDFPWGIGITISIDNEYGQGFRKLVNIEDLPHLEFDAGVLGDLKPIKFEDVNRVFHAPAYQGMIEIIDYYYRKAPPYSDSWFRENKCERYMSAEEKARLSPELLRWASRIEVPNE